MLRPPKDSLILDRTVVVLDPFVFVAIQILLSAVEVAYLVPQAFVAWNEFSSESEHAAWWASGLGLLLGLKSTIVCGFFVGRKILAWMENNHNSSYIAYNNHDETFVFSLWVCLIIYSSAVNFSFFPCLIAALQWIAFVLICPRATINAVFRVLAGSMITFIFNNEKSFPDSPLKFERFATWMDAELKRQSPAFYEEMISNKNQQGGKIITPCIAQVSVESLGSSPKGFIGETVRLNLRLKNDNVLKLIAKCTPQDMVAKAKMRAGAHVYCREIFFYEKIAPRLLEKMPTEQLQVPKAVATKLGKYSGSNLILMSDESSTLSPGDESVGGSWEQACSVSTRYATFHAIFWENSYSSLVKKYDCEWLGTFDWMNATNIVLHQICTPCLREIGNDDALNGLVTYQVQLAMKRLVENLPKVLLYLKKNRPFTICHADSRIENMMWPKQKPTATEQYRPARDAPVLDTYKDVRWLSLDWQTVTASIGVYDLAYFVTLELNTDHVENDVALVRNYHNVLVENGVKNYSFETCWKDYSLSCLIASLIPFVVMSPITLGAKNNAERGRAIRMNMLERANKAILRCRSVEALEDILAQINGREAGRTGVVHTSHVENEKPRETVLRAEDDSFSHHTKESVNNTPWEKYPGLGKRDMYDRWYLNGYFVDKFRVYFFGVACGFYPGRGLVDASFSMLINGKQRNFRCSRSSQDADFGARETVVGPMTISVVTPLREGSLLIDYGEGGRGLKVNLKYTPRSDAVAEPKFDVDLGMGKFNYTRLTQLIEWNGTVEINGEKIAVNNWFGTRDRSWGMRPHPTADKPPAVNKFLANVLLGSAFSRAIMNRVISLKKPPVQFYWLWNPINFHQGGGILFHAQENFHGSPQNSAAKIIDPATRKTVDVVKQSHYSTYLKGTRHVSKMVMVCETRDGDVWEVTCVADTPFCMSGIGYNHPTYAHGSKYFPKHVVVVEDSIVTTEVDRNRQMFWHVQELVRVKAVHKGSNREVIAEYTGDGVVEQLVIGRHDPSGFRLFYDV